MIFFFKAAALTAKTKLKPVLSVALCDKSTCGFDQLTTMQRRRVESQQWSAAAAAAADFVAMTTMTSRAPSTVSVRLQMVVSIQRRV